MSESESHFGIKKSECKKICKCKIGKKMRTIYKHKSGKMFYVKKSRGKMIVVTLGKNQKKMCMDKIMPMSKRRRRRKSKSRKRRTKSRKRRTKSKSRRTKSRKRRTRSRFGYNNFPTLNQIEGPYPSMSFGSASMPGIIDVMGPYPQMSFGSASMPGLIDVMGPYPQMSFGSA